MVVSDEAVEAAARADHAFGRLGDDPDWDQLTDADRDSYRRAARSYLTAAAPLIVEAALRARQVEPTPDEAWAQMAELARDAALRTAAVDALRTVAGFIDHAAALPQVPGSIEKARAEGMRRAAELVRERVEELERGGDR